MGRFRHPQTHLPPDDPARPLVRVRRPYGRPTHSKPLTGGVGGRDEALLSLRRPALPPVTGAGAFFPPTPSRAAPQPNQPLNGRPKRLPRATHGSICRPHMPCDLPCQSAGLYTLLESPRPTCVARVCGGRAPTPQNHDFGPVDTLERPASPPQLIAGPTRVPGRDAEPHPALPSPSGASRAENLTSSPLRPPLLREAVSWPCWSQGGCRWPMRTKTGRPDHLGTVGGQRHHGECG